MLCGHAGWVWFPRLGVAFWCDQRRRKGAGVRVARERDGGIVTRVVLLDSDGGPLGPPTQFLDHLFDGGYSPHTVCAYGYDLRYLFEFLDREQLDWRAFSPARALEFLGFLRRRPSRRPAQRLDLAVATEAGRRLAPATV